MVNASAGEYVRRVVDDELDALLPALPAISLEGPRGVGKTETALRRAGTTHRLDVPSERAVISAEPARLVRGARPVLIDEWQRLPESWDIVRRAVDADSGPGQYLLTGSAAPLEHPTHSGAGRIVTIRMRPLTLSERGIGSPTVSIADLLTGRRRSISGSTDVTLETYVDEIVASGFPALRGLPNRARRAQLDGYLARLAEHDFTEQGRPVRYPARLRRWLTAYAAATATTATYETIRDAATGGENDKPARSTTQPYRDILERLWIIEPVPAWLPTRNPIARLAGPAKHHLADPALAARLLGADSAALLEARPLGPPIPRSGPMLGGLFESLVTLGIRTNAQAAEAEVRHLRTKGGEREVDLIVERGDHRILGIEVKLSRTVVDEDVRHLHWLRDQIGEDLLDAIVITTGQEAYRRPDGIAVVPAALLGP
jgi:predicted AAA+ superfamily ATPase